MKKFFTAWIQGCFLSLFFSNVHSFTIKSSAPVVNTTSAVQNTGSMGGITLSSSQNTQTQTASTQGQAWSLTTLESKAPSIYTDAQFPQIQKTLYQLSQTITSIIANLKKLQNQNTKVIWTIKKNTSTTSSTGSKNVTTAITSNDSIVTFDYSGTYVAFQKVINGSNTSFLTAVQSIYSIYQGLFPAFQDYVARLGQQASGDAQLYFTQAPFVLDSYFLSTIQTLLNSMINYMKVRASLVTSSTYTYNNNSEDLFDPKNGAFVFCDSIASTLSNYLDTAFKSISDIQNISPNIVSKLQTNYKTILIDYAQQKNMIVLQTVHAITQNLSQKYQAHLLTSQQMNADPLDLLSLEKFVAAASNAYSNLNTRTSDTTSVSQKNVTVTSDQMMSAIENDMAHLYSYNLKLLLVTIEDSVKKTSITLPYAISDERQTSFQNTVFQALQLVHQMASGAAIHALNAKDSVGYNVYSVQATTALSIVSAWKNGISAYNNQSYANALSYFNTALSLSVQLNLISFSSYIVTIIQKINLEYEQKLFQLYVSYPTYATALQTYIQHALSTDTSTYEADQDLWNTLWYPATSPLASSNPSSKTSIYQGFYTICSSALQTIQSILHSVNLNQLTLPSNQITALKQALTLLNPITGSLQEMLVQGSIFPDKQPADSNLYVNYYTPWGYREVYQQYQYIIKNIDEIDKILQTSGASDNMYVPLQTLLAGQNFIKNFGTLFRLHYARWAYCMGMYAVQYASNKNCLSDKVCIVYQKTVYQFALCALTDAYRLYKQLNITNVSAAIAQQLQNIQSAAAGLQDTADSLIKSDNSIKPLTPDQPWYDRLYYVQVLACNDPKKYGSIYLSALNDLLTKESNNAFSRSIPSLYQAYLAYQGYIWSIKQKDTVGQQKYMSVLTSSLQTCVQQSNALQTKITASSQDSNALIPLVSQLQELQKTLDSYSVDQEYQQGILDLQNIPFLTSVDIASTNKNVNNKQITFINKINCTLSNSMYVLAQLYVQQAYSLFNQFKTLVNNKQYGAISDDMFSTMMSYYSKALENYTTLGLFDQVIHINKYISNTMAMYYYSLVIPSDVVGNVSLATASVSESDISQTNVKTSSLLLKSSTSTAVSTSKVTNTALTTSKDSNMQSSFELPYYLVRLWEHDLSSYKMYADQSVNAAQQSQVASYLLSTQSAYTTIVEEAKKLIGSADSKTIVRNIVLPLYKQLLIEGNYQKIGKTIDQEVERYNAQLQGMITQGMIINGTVFKTSFEIVQRSGADGQMSIILREKNIPVSAVPQFLYDKSSALILYTQYQNFFQQTTQPIQVQGNVFFPIPDVAVYKNAQKAINQTYFIAAQSYDNSIKQMRDQLLEIKDTTKVLFDDYAQLYTLFDSFYAEIFGYYSALDQVQQDSGVTTYDISALYLKKFQEYGAYSSVFLLGDPSSSEYIARVSKVAANFLAALNYTSDPTTQASIYTASGQIYKKTGDIAASYVIPFPSINGYPSSKSNNFPSQSTTFTSTCLVCDTASVPKSPSSQTLTLYAYEQAQGYYQQALQNYQQAYSVTNNNQLQGQLKDSNILTSWMFNMLYALHYAAQNSAVFGRNAFDTSGTGVECTFSNMFLSLQSSSGSADSVNMQFGMNNYASNAYAMNQYRLLKTAVLNALLYLANVASMANSFAQAAGFMATTKDTSYTQPLGKAYLCAIARYIPQLTAIDPLGKVLPALSTYACIQTTYPFDIGSALNINQQYALLHIDTFMQWHQYVINQLCGTTPDAMIKAMQNRNNLFALAVYANDLYGIMRNVYANAFLPQLVAASDAVVANTSSNSSQINTALTNVQQSINADMQSAQQNRLVNAAGYVG